LLLQAISTFVFSRKDAAFGINCGLVCGYRNWALTLAITAGSLGKDFETLVAIGQFGVMLMPLPMIAILKKFTFDRNN
ncbi:MAG: hypothetical protein R3261_03535, partial [Alphaproteobacteria bacterium]|nr:hypothetical protein [Alphaproteobacteria bacterium]